MTDYDRFGHPRFGVKTYIKLNISSFWICSIKADKCLRTYYKLRWKYVNTAEIISKVTIALSLINSNKDFDFVGWVIKTPRLFYFRSVKFHHVKETHNINSLLTLLEIVVASQLNEGQRNKSLSRFVDNLKTPTQSDLKVHALRYANELLYYIRLAFQKLLQTRQTIRNNKKLCKKGPGYD